MKNRQLDMLKAAMPYTAPHFRKPLQVYIQTSELSDFIQSNESESEIEAYDIGNVGDVEGMMEKIRPFCSSDERDMIDMALNFMRAQKMYQCYRNYKAASAASASSNEEKAGSNGSGNNTGGNNGDNGMMDFLMSQLSPEQKTMFEQMSSAMKM